MVIWKKYGTIYKTMVLWKKLWYMCFTENYITSIYEGK